MRREDPWRQEFLLHGRKETDEEKKTNAANADKLQQEIEQAELKDRLKLREVLERLIQDTYDCLSEVMFEIAEAKREQQRCQLILNPKQGKVRPSMGRQVFTELRRYNRPPAHIGKLAQAFLLLLGHDEYSTFVTEHTCTHKQ